MLWHIFLHIFSSNICDNFYSLMNSLLTRCPLKLLIQFLSGEVIISVKKQLSDEDTNLPSLKICFVTKSSWGLLVVVIISHKLPAATLFFSQEVYICQLCNHYVYIFPYEVSLVLLYDSEPPRVFFCRPRKLTWTFY